MAVLTANDFIKSVFIDELELMISQHPYISFMVMGIGIEFLGKCISIEQNWNESGNSKSDFEAAVKEIPSLKRYTPYLTSHKLYSSFRCGMAHAASPKHQITLSSKKEMEHLVEHNDRLNLKVEDFYSDFKDACEYVITRTLPNGDKMDNSFLETPDSFFFSSGSTVSIALQ